MFFVLSLAANMDARGKSAHYLAAEDNERRLKDRISMVFKDDPRHLTYHAVMSSEQQLPRGSDAILHIEQVAKGTGPQCIIVDKVQSILKPPLYKQKL